MPATSSTGEAIINGTLDTGDPAVVLSFAQVPGAMFGALCSGEVVSPHVVLTAAHCVAPSEVGQGAEFIIFTGNTLGDDGAPPSQDILQVKETHYDPTFMFDPKTGDQDDVGIIILAQPTSIPPLPINHFPLPASATGAAARIVGFGLTDGNDSTGATAGTKHTAPTILYNIVSPTLTLFDGKHSDCEGDSGGPALYNIDGKERIVGITQTGYSGCPVTSAAVDTLIDAYTPFIDKYIDEFDPPMVQPGGTCTEDSQCGALPCLSGICAEPCNPMATTNTCPMGTQCMNIDNHNFCSSHHGCSMGGGGSASSMLGLFVAAAWLLLRRRRALVA